MSYRIRIKQIIELVECDIAMCSDSVVHYAETSSVDPLEVNYPADDKGLCSAMQLHMYRTRDQRLFHSQMAIYDTVVGPIEVPEWPAVPHE